jgi:hypothetical protein
MAVLAANDSGVRCTLGYLGVVNLLTDSFSNVALLLANCGLVFNNGKEMFFGILGFPEQAFFFTRL